jgi:LysM repeat protein
MAFANSQTRGHGKQSMSYYRVRKGDTLAKVARVNQVSVGQVAKWNHLRTHAKLRIGQRMKIYRSGESTGSLFAGASYSGKQRVSGVSAIILQDEKQPIALDLPKSNKIELPNLVAQSDAIEIPSADQPALIKISDSDIADGMNVLDTVASNTSVAMTGGGAHYENGMISPEGDATVSASSGLSTATHRPSQHTVKRGESLATIAIHYDLKVDQLKKLNGLTGSKITPNQKLWLVSKKTAVPTQKTNPTMAISYAQGSQSNSIYVVKPRDTLSSVAKTNRVTVSQLKTWNQLTADQIRVGQKLKILKGRTATVSTNNSKVLIHQIKNGDTLWTLSRRYQVSVSDIKKWNKLASDRVQLNQKIRILAANPLAKKQIATL